MAFHYPQTKTKKHPKLKHLDYKSKCTEFEVQATAYNILIENNIKTRGELSISTGDKSRGARFDLLVYSIEEKLLFTIEVKDSENAVAHSKKEHYEKLAGVPNFQISGMSEAKKVMNIVEQFNSMTKEGQLEVPLSSLSIKINP